MTQKVSQAAQQKEVPPASRISIIVPAYNEEAAIERMQQQLRRVVDDGCEVIFVDGGSTDATCSLIDPAFRLLHAPKSRGAQMNEGAQASSGDILWFLHCDSQLPKDAVEEVRRVANRCGVGCFKLAFAAHHLVILACQIGSNLRCRLCHIMYGDQGIFIQRELFFQLGMFPCVPLMEDYQFSLTLRERGIVPGLARTALRTSARRFPAGVVPKVRVWAQMAHLRRLYRQGVSPQELAQRYRDIR